MSDHLPTLKIPPDHELATQLYDLIEIDQRKCFVRIAAAIAANDAGELHLLEKEMDGVSAKIDSVCDEYREECGGEPDQKVGLTYNKYFQPVVTARPGPTPH